MPLASRQGPPDPTPDPDGVAPQTITTMQTALDQVPYIEDTFVNKTSFNPETYAEQFQLLQRYASGSRIKVTYFLISTPTGGFQRSTDIDQSNSRSSLKTSYTQINNFELVMQGPIRNTFDQDTKETKVFGEALLYPGMKPRMGDELVMPIGDANYGIFRVTGVERLSYRQGSNHKITYFLNRIATDDDINYMKASVTEELWFDQATYLGDATTLLKADSYRYLKIMRQMRNILIRYYYNTFYDKSMSSIIAPNGSYDPYLVNYLTSKISIEDSIYRPVQLYPGFQNYENTLWSRLNDITNRQLTNIQANYSYALYRAGRMDVMITSLVNRLMIAMDNPNRVAMGPPLTTEPFISIPGSGPPPPGICSTPPDGRFDPGSYNTPCGIEPLLYVSTQEGYVFTSNFYTNNKAAMTPFEFLVWAVIYDRQINDIGDFINTYINQYTSLTFDEQYYFIPLYLWLIDVGINQISAPSDFMT